MSARSWIMRTASGALYIGICVAAYLLGQVTQQRRHDRWRAEYEHAQVMGPLTSTWDCQIILDDPQTGVRVYRLATESRVLFVNATGGIIGYFIY